VNIGRQPQRAFGLIRLPSAHPDVARSLADAIKHTALIPNFKPRSPLHIYRSLPHSWGPTLDQISDIAFQAREARREPYFHRTSGEIDRRNHNWFRHRLKFEFRARTALATIQSANLCGAIVWNGQNGTKALGSLALRELGIPTLYSELTPFKGRYFLDHLGVNAASSLQAVSLNQIPLYEDEEELYFSLRRNYVGRRSSSDPLNCPESLPRSFVFAPLQVPMDSQILFHGGNIKRHCEYLEVLRSLVELLPANLVLVVKPHPLAPFSRSCLQDSIGSGVFDASGFETRDLLERCTAIVTVNSSVGADGFLFDKPVVALGNAPWNKPGLASQARTPEEVAVALTRPPEFEKRLRQRFLAHWYHRYTWSEHEGPDQLRDLVEQKLRVATPNVVQREVYAKEG
jgi:Capsule polysaccharide biosynthesis protein